MRAHTRYICIKHTYIHTKTRTHSRALRSNVRAKSVHIREPAICFSWQQIVSTAFCSFRLCADMMSQYKSLLSFVRKQWGRLTVDCNCKVHQSAVDWSEPRPSCPATWPKFIRTGTLTNCGKFNEYYWCYNYNTCCLWRLRHDLLIPWSTFLQVEAVRREEEN